MSRLLLLIIVVRIVVHARKMALESLMHARASRQTLTFQRLYELWVDKICARLEAASRG